jgi:hypothetical protein
VAKYVIGVATMPMSMTLTPAARMPSDNADSNSGPDSLPSRPMANVSLPRSRASEPAAWPTARTMSGVSVRPTTPRMS